MGRPKKRAAASRANGRTPKEPKIDGRRPAGADGRAMASGLIRKLMELDNFPWRDDCWHHDCDNDTVRGLISRCHACRTPRRVRFRVHGWHPHESAPYHGMVGRFFNRPLLRYEEARGRWLAGHRGYHAMNDVFAAKAMVAASNLEHELVAQWARASEDGEPVPYQRVRTGTQAPDFEWQPEFHLGQFGMQCPLRWDWESVVQLSGLNLSVNGVSNVWHWTGEPDTSDESSADESDQALEDARAGWCMMRNKR